jgi:hypothetical protein
MSDFSIISRGFSSEQNRMACILFNLVLYLIRKREIRKDIRRMVKRHNTKHACRIILSRSGDDVIGDTVFYYYWCVCVNSTILIRCKNEIVIKALF